MAAAAPNESGKAGREGLAAVVVRRALDDWREIAIELVTETLQVKLPDTTVNLRMACHSAGISGSR